MAERLFPEAKMKRQIGGRRERPWGIEAYVKVGTRQIQHTFSKDASEEEIQEWCIKMRRKLLETSSERGTLAHDIDRFLSIQTGRRKTDFEIWLRKWKTALGKKSRVSITVADVRDQFAAWRAEGYSSSSLNHLRTVAISLWKHCDGRRHECPVLEIPRFEENNTRQGFFEHDQFLKVLEQLPPDYADLAEFLYYSGWRHAEGRELTWAEIDLPGGVIRLSPERSKNGDGRVLPLEGPIKAVIERRLTKELSVSVFTYRRAKDGPLARIGDWRKTWQSACRAAGCPGKLVHDFRRTVVRNLTRAGAPEKVAMAWTGHKTRAVFDRYNIVNERDLRAAGAKLVEHLEQKG